MTKCRRVERGVLIVCMGAVINAFRIWFVSLKGGDPSEDVNVDNKIILKYNKNGLGGCGLDSPSSG
jgi:hypothetical protein